MYQPNIFTSYIVNNYFKTVNVILVETHICLGVPFSYQTVYLSIFGYRSEDSRKFIDEKYGLFCKIQNCVLLGRRKRRFSFDSNMRIRK